MVGIFIAVTVMGQIGDCRQWNVFLDGQGFRKDHDGIVKVSISSFAGSLFFW